MRTCSTTSQTLSSIPRMLRSQRPASSTRTVNPVWKNLPIRWLSTLTLMPSKLCSSPSISSATRGPSREPTRPPPSPSVRNAGSTARSNRSAKQRPLHALYAPSCTQKRNTAARILCAQAEATSKPSSTAAWPPRQDAPTVVKPTQLGAETAANAPRDPIRALPQPAKKARL